MGLSGLHFSTGCHSSLSIALLESWNASGSYQRNSRFKVWRTKRLELQAGQRIQPHQFVPRFPQPQQQQEGFFPGSADRSLGQAPHSPTGIKPAQLPSGPKALVHDGCLHRPTAVPDKKWGSVSFVSSRRGVLKGSWRIQVITLGWSI